jgi:hypothetical protein
MRKSPVEQVQQQMFEVMDLVEDRLDDINRGSMGRPIPQPTHGYALIFPFLRSAEQLERFELPRELILDSDELNDLEAAIKRAMAYWNKKRTVRHPLTTMQYQTILDRVISPAVNLAPDLNDAFDVERRAFHKLDIQQSFAIEVIVRNRRMAVEGGAGTGKTMIAIEAARRMRDAGKHVLLMCFNKHLREHLRRKVSELDHDAGLDEAGVIDVYSFHQLAHDSCEAIGESFEPPDGSDEEARKRFWNETCAEYIELAAIDEAIGPWDALIVDEWQDFDSAWMSALRAIVRDGPDGQIALLYDSSQAIFDRHFAAPSPLEFPVVPLPYNYRNTQEITRYLDDTLEKTCPAHPEAPTGIPPEVHKQHSPKQARKDIAALIRTLVEEEGIDEEQIVILTPHRSSSFIGNRGSIEGVHYSQDPFDRKGNVLWTTLSSFKGLESDVVILADIDENDPRSGKREVYVAASRARHRLYIWRKDL